MSPSSLTVQPAVRTPCIGICAMHRSGFCAGCARTLEEIGAWPLLSASDRLSIMEELSARKGAFASDSAL